MSDVFDEPITLPDNSEGAAFGAAVLGFISSGKLKSIADTANLVHAKKVYTPIEENAAVYRKLYDILFASIKNYKVNLPILRHINRNYNFQPKRRCTYDAS